MNSKKVFIGILIFILLAPIIHSIGIGLWVEEINFEPNLNQNFDAFINNNVGSDIRVKLVKGGALTEYLTFSDEYLDIPTGGRAFFTFNLKFPETITPGRNRIDIGAEDVTQTTAGGISAKTAVYMGFYVRAPYPGKYIEASFSVPDIEKEQIATLSVSLTSRGDEIIDKVDGFIEIFEQDNKIDVLNLEPIINLKPGESKTINTKWNTIGHSVGGYKAKAYVNYDNKQLTLDANFKIGTLLIKITNYTKELYKDEINKFDIDIENLWNIEINEAYGEVELNNQKAKTLKTSLPPWGKTKINAYIDTTNMALGNHIANIKVYYADKITEEIGNITILPKIEKIEFLYKIPPTAALLIGIIILLLIGNILLALHLMKHKKIKKRRIKKRAKK